MKLIIQKDRKAIPVGTYGTQNENDVTELTLKVPEEYQNWNKRIVFLTSEGNFWDYIQDDTYIVKRSITKYTSVKAYIWLTNDEQDFRSKEFTLCFWDNKNADDLIPTEEQIDGFNTLITTLNLEITRVTGLETEVTNLVNNIQNKLDNGEFDGRDGIDGKDGKDGTDGQNGQDGEDGQDGKSAYQIWLDNGNSGTEQDFLNSLKGEKGQDGLNGANGTNGVDGFSPTVAVQETEEGATISITDKNGTTSVEVKNGKDGKNGENGINGINGYTPVKGIDYWTSEDKQEIKDYCDQQIGIIESLLQEV